MPQQADRFGRLGAILHRHDRTHPRAASILASFRRAYERALGFKAAHVAKRDHAQSIVDAEQRRIARLDRQLAGLEAAMRPYEDGWDGWVAKADAAPHRRTPFPSGTCSRGALRILRERSPLRMTVMEIARELIEREGIQGAPPREILNAVRANVGANLINHRRRGRVISDQGVPERRWWIEEKDITED